jgi:hypothetical protein
MLAWTDTLWFWMPHEQRLIRCQGQICGRPHSRPVCDFGKTEVLVGWAKKAREDDSTKDFKRAAKAIGKPSPKEKKKLDKIAKHLSKDEKI